MILKILDSCIFKFFEIVENRENSFLHFSFFNSFLEL